jgi:hypothetical protein
MLVIAIMKFHFGTMMSADYTRTVARILGEAVEADKHRVQLLNDVAEGRVKLTPIERQDLVSAEAHVQNLLNKLVGEESAIKRRMRVVDMNPEHSAKELPPRRLLDTYALLCHAAYGSDPAISTGDPVVKPGIGKRRARTTTNQEEGRVGAAKQPGKRPGASRRSVVRDRQAYEMKERVDRRLRRLASELEAFLAGGDADIRSFQCSRCGRHAEEGWGFCPWCGHEVVEVSE